MPSVFAAVTAIALGLASVSATTMDLGRPATSLHQVTLLVLPPTTMLA